MKITELLFTVGVVLFLAVFTGLCLYSASLSNGSAVRLEKAVAAYQTAVAAENK